MTRDELRQAIAGILRAGGVVNFPEKWDMTSWYTYARADRVEGTYNVSGEKTHGRFFDADAAAESLIDAVFKPDNLAMCINGILQRTPLPPEADPEDVPEEEWLRQIAAYQKEFFYLDYPWATPPQEAT